MLRLGCPGSLMSYLGPHFMLLLPIYVLYSNVTYISCIMSCGNKIVSYCFKLSDFLICTAKKLRLSGYTLPNINTFENECWYFLENLRIVVLKLLELTQLTSPKISIYFNFVWRWGSVVMSTFLN